MAQGRWFSIESPWAGPSDAGVRGSPIAVIRLAASSDAIDGVLTNFGWARVDRGAIGLRVVRSGDEVLVARSSLTCAFLMPVGAPVIVDAVVRALESLGWARALEVDVRERFPEARTLAEACALDAIARAPSPRAIDAILRQRDLWDREPGAPLAPSPSPLDHLLTPPSIIAVGRPNIGKSSLLNAMARRPIAIASDEPGTTRDHVGAEVECDGLVVRWIDTPGIPGPGAPTVGPIDRIAQDRARALVAGADLLLVCADARAGAIAQEELPPLAPRTKVVRIGLRADLGAPPSGVDVLTSARTGLGLPELARAIRCALVADTELATRSRWRFHPQLPGV